MILKLTDTGVSPDGAQLTPLDDTGAQIYWLAQSGVISNCWTIVV